MARLAVASHRLQLCHPTPYGAMLVSPALWCWMLIICIVKYMSFFILSFVLSIQGYRELCDFGDLFMLGTRTLCKEGVMIRCFGPLRRYVGANVSWYTWWSFVWSRSGYTTTENAIVRMYNAVSVVTLLVYI